MQFPFIAPVQLNTEDPTAMGRLATARGIADGGVATFDISRLLSGGEGEEVPPMPQVIALETNPVDGGKIGSGAKRAIEAFVVANRDVFAGDDMVALEPDAEPHSETARPLRDSEKTKGLMGRAESAERRPSPNADIPSEAAEKDGEADAPNDPRDMPLGDPLQATKPVAQSDLRTKEISVDFTEASPAVPPAHTDGVRHPGVAAPEPQTAVSPEISGVDGTRGERVVRLGPPSGDHALAPMKIDHSGPRRTDVPRSGATSQNNQVVWVQTQMSGSPQMSQRGERADHAAATPVAAAPPNSLGNQAAIANLDSQSTQSNERPPRETDPAQTQALRATANPQLAPVATRAPRGNSAPRPGDILPASSQIPHTVGAAGAHGPILHTASGSLTAETANRPPTKQLGPHGGLSQPGEAPRGALAAPEVLNRSQMPPVTDPNSPSSRLPFADTLPVAHEATGRNRSDSRNTPVDSMSREAPSANTQQQQPERSDRLAPAAFGQNDWRQPMRATPLAAPLPSADSRSPDTPVIHPANTGFAGGGDAVDTSDVVTPRAARVHASPASSPPPAPPRPDAPVSAFETRPQPDTPEPSTADVDVLPAEGRITDVRSSTTTAAPGTLPPHPARHDPANVTLQIADSIRANGERATELHLQPEELGRVRFSVSHDSAGLSVSLSVDRPDTLDLIRRHVDLLADDLRRIGYNSVNFSFDGGGAHQRQAHANAAPEASDFPVPPGDERPPTALANPSEPQSPARHGASGLDIRM